MEGLSSLYELASDGDPSIRIAILDGPIDLAHPCFSGASIESSATTRANARSDGPAKAHGTHVASVLLGQPDAGSVRGIAPRCHAISIPIFGDGADGALETCSQIDLARALSLALAHGAHVINVSGGQFAPTGTAHPLLLDAVERCAEHSALIVAAAGNDGCACLHIPGALPSVLAIGAMDARGELLDFSNWGGVYAEQGLLVPGEHILGAVPGGGVEPRTGTSFATAVASGLVALLLSVQKRRGLPVDPFAVRRALLDSAVDCAARPSPDCSRLLVGRLDVEAALQLLTRPGKDSMEANETREAEIPEAAARPQALEDAAPREALVEQAIARGVTPAEAASPRTTNGARGRVAECAAPADARRIAPSSACGCAEGPAPLVYALGQVGYDFGTEARRDAIAQEMGGSPFAPREFLAYLAKNPWSAASVMWTLELDAIPIYVIRPVGPYSATAYERLRGFLDEQLHGRSERVSVPGIQRGMARLLNGEVVPMIEPDLRGMYSWSTDSLVKSLAGAESKSAKSREPVVEAVRGFLERAYYELRNLGLAPQERAMNFAATNAYQAAQIFERCIADELELDEIGVERSPICRPESDCWDVRLVFFDPAHRMERARRVYRFTVDVSDVVPVTIGPVRSWSVF